VKRLLALAAAALLVAVVGIAGAAHLALGPVSSSQTEIVVVIPKGSSLPAVAKLLDEAGVIRSARAFALLARVEGVADALRAGEYAFAPSLPAVVVLERIAAGAVMTHRLVLPEGLRMEEIAARIEAAGLGSASAFLEVARDPASAAAFDVEGADLEGYLFPETYALARGIPARDVARMMVEHFHAVWRGIEPLARERGLSMREVVVLASLVEKETGAPEERPLIASVFLNRLARGMRLGGGSTSKIPATGTTRTRTAACRRARSRTPAPPRCAPWSSPPSRSISTSCRRRTARTSSREPTRSTCER
jgi:UPF0755 protein